MKLLLMTLLLASSATFASAQPAEPSTESIERLIVASRTEKMMEIIYGQMESGMRQGVQQSLKGQTLTDEQRKVIEYAPTRFINVMRDELPWSVIKADIVKVYRESFSQAEIDGLLAFYVSPVGLAFVEKMPLVTQRSGALMQARMATLIPKMQAAMEQAMADARLTR